MHYFGQIVDELRDSVCASPPRRKMFDNVSLNLSRLQQTVCHRSRPLPTIHPDTAGRQPSARPLSYHKACSTTTKCQSRSSSPLQQSTTLSRINVASRQKGSPCPNYVPRRCKDGSVIDVSVRTWLANIQHGALLLCAATSGVVDATDTSAEHSIAGSLSVET
jgi:hypothetical protein